jgi:hypothetical protein
LRREEMVIIVNLELDVVGEGVGLGSPFAKLSTFQNSKLSGLEETHTTKSVVNPKSTFTQLSNQFKVLTNRKSSQCVYRIVQCQTNRPIERELGALRERKSRLLGSTVGY